MAGHPDSDGTPLVQQAAAMIAKIEASLEWMRRSKSPDTVQLIAELQQALDDLRAELRCQDRL